MSLGVSQSTANAFSNADRDSRCKERNNGDHVWNNFSEWHIGFYSHKGKYGSRMWKITGKPYWKRIRVCKDCKARDVEIKSEKPVESKQMTKKYQEGGQKE